MVSKDPITLPGFTGLAKESYDRKIRMSATQDTLVIHTKTETE